MLIKRIITGIVGIAVAAYVVQTGGWLFCTAVTVLALIGWFEFWRAFNNIEQKSWFAGGLLAILVLLSCTWLGNPAEMLFTVTAAILLVLAKTVFNYHTFKLRQAMLTLGGIFYIGLPFAHLILLRLSHSQAAFETGYGDMTLGCAFLWIAFIGTWASDTFAFFVGSKFGRHKLCPDISPGKTKEGFIGGLAGTVLSCALLGYWWDFSLVHMAVLGALIAVSATLGDLVESIIKRTTGIKDSGQILPGHGGVLDRFDSILFTVPLVYYYCEVFKIY